jgi:hypothetical protein
MRPVPVRPKTLLALAVLVLALAASAPAVAQQTPTLGAPDTTTSAPVTPVTTTTSGNGGLKTWQELLIFAAGLALIAGIAFAILGDARESASKLGHGRVETDRRNLHQHHQKTKQRSRAKGRAAKAQRRRNRI